MVDRYLDRQGPTLEAGTGGGRISLGLHQIGFQNLSAFDFVPRFIEQAKAKDTAGAIDFRVGDVDQPVVDPVPRHGVSLPDPSSNATPRSAAGRP